MSCCDDKRPICRWSLLLLVAGWFLLALFVGEMELLSILPGAAIPAVVLTLTLALLGAYSVFSPLRRCLEGLDVRALIAVHLTRLVGIYFLYLNSRGQLPGAFAIPAGLGDIIVALGAAALLAIPGAAKSKRAVLTWNIAGFLDILFVVKTAAGIVVTQRDSMAVMTHLPLSFLPTMIVPLILFTHIVIFRSLWKTANRPEPAAPASVDMEREPNLVEGHTLSEIGR